MPWTRFGQVYAVGGAKPWAKSHAALPVALPQGSDVVRFFVSTRASDRRSSVGWVDLELTEDGFAVLREADQPVLGPGSDGAFDDSGIGLGCVVPVEQRQRLYYMGWNLGVRAPWRNAIGLAERCGAASAFERFSPGPILDRSPEDPYTLSYPWVVQDRPGQWRMWYGSNLTWGSSNADMSHVIKLARSADGIRWHRDGAVVIGFASHEEYALARPSVVRLDGRYLMCFACRGTAYRIGAAVSPDGERWTRCDESLGLNASITGWDNEMVCYPCLFLHRDRLWMAYNGNGYGATGFGLALWDGVLPIT